MPPLQSTRKILAVNDINNTPMIPPYNSMFGMHRCSPGQLHYYSNKKWIPCQKKSTRPKSSSFGRSKSSSIAFSDKHMRSMAKKLKVKINTGKRRKTQKKLFGDVMRKGKTILRSKTMTAEKKYVMKHCALMAKKLKIKHRGRSHIAVWNEIMKKGSQKEKVYKKRKLKKYNNKKIYTGRKRYTRKKTSFGSWWDNTQQLYGGIGASKQSADASTLNGPYPFYNNDSWQPYYSIDGPSFGMKRKQMHRPHMRYVNPLLRNKIINMTKHRQMETRMRKKPTVFPRPPMKKYNHFGVPIIEYNNSYPQQNSLDPAFDYNSIHLNVPRPQPAWPSYSNIGQYPSSLDSPYPFSMHNKRWS